MGREIWIFRPKGLAAADAYVDEAKRIAGDRGWQPVLRSTVPAKSATGRGIVLIDPGDAVNLYARMHRAHVAVLSIQAPGAPGPLVCTRPDRRESLAARAVRSLRLFCAYKAFFRRLVDASRPLGWLGSFDSWCSSVDCLGDHDPRCLPLHVFSPRRQAYLRSLRHPTARKAFEDDHHRHGGGREDAAQFAWLFGPAHARQPGDQLAVTGRPLSLGLHWDVETDRERRLCTPTEDWLVREYVNVTPDARLRGRMPYAKKRA